MANVPVWKPLLARADGIPNLLVSISFQSSSYEVHITDLANVWCEILDRKSICMRGFQESTSIDPSEDQDQMLHFLKRIRASLDPSLQEYKDTSISLSRQSAHGGHDNDGLVLYITCILPQPLEPLKWPMYLTKQPPSTLAYQLVLPLIQDHVIRMQQAEHLLDLIHQKDTIISRLIDKLEGTGTSLEQIFNQLSGRRKATRSVADQRVRGLAPFNEDDFHREVASAHDTNTAAQDITVLLDSAFGDPVSAVVSSDINMAVIPALDEWWARLKTGNGLMLVERTKTGVSAAVGLPGSRRNRNAHDHDRIQGRPGQEDQSGAGNADPDDDFQVQATPPHVTRSLAERMPSAQKPASGAAVDSKVRKDGHSGTTESEEAIPDSVPFPPPPAGLTDTTHSTEAVGRENAVSPPVEPLESEDEASETASEADQDANPSESRPVNPPEPKRGGKPTLGRIGGTSGYAAHGNPTGQAVEDKQAASSDRTSPAQTSKPRKLGVIGNYSAPPATLKEDRANSGSKGQAEETDQREGSPPPPEVEERANKKRLQLQQTLDHRGTATRKKRKF